MCPFPMMRYGFLLYLGCLVMIVACGDDSLTDTTRKDLNARIDQAIAPLSAQAATPSAPDSWKTLIWEAGGKGITSQPDPARWAQSDIVCPSAYKIFSPTDGHAAGWVDQLKAHNPDIKVVGFDFPWVLYRPDHPMHRSYDWYGDRYDAVTAVRGPWYVADTAGDTSMASFEMKAYVANLTNPEVRDSLVAVTSRKIRASGNLRNGTGLLFDIWEFRCYGVLLGMMRSKSWRDGGRPDVDGDADCDTTDARLWKWGCISFVRELRAALGDDFIVGANSASALVDSTFASVLDFVWLEDIHRPRWDVALAGDLLNFFKPTFDGYPDRSGGGDGKGRNWLSLKRNLRQSPHGPLILFEADVWSNELLIMSMLDDSFHVCLSWPNLHMQGLSAYSVRRYYYPADHRLVDIHLHEGGAVSYFDGATGDSTVQYREFADGSVLVVWKYTDVFDPRRWITDRPLYLGWVAHGSGATRIVHGDLPGGSFTMKGGRVLRKNVFTVADRKTIVVSSDTSTTRVGPDNRWPSSWDRAIQDCRWAHIMSNAFGGSDSTRQMTYTSEGSPFLISHSYTRDEGSDAGDWPLKISQGPAYQSLLWYPLAFLLEYDVTAAELWFRQFSAGANDSAGDTLWCHFMAVGADTVWVDRPADGPFRYEAATTWTAPSGAGSTNWGARSSYYWLSRRGPNRKDLIKRGVRSYVAQPLEPGSWYAFDLTEALRQVSYGMPNAGMIISYRDAERDPAVWQAYGPEGAFTQVVGDSAPFLVITAARRDTVGSGRSP